MPKKYTIEPDRIVVVTLEDEDETNGNYGSFAEDLIYGETYSPDEDMKEFLENFTMGPRAISSVEDFPYGITYCQVITRKSDGRQFGYEYYYGGGKYGEPYPEPNGDDYGFDYNTYVWLPVEASGLSTYSVIRNAK
jgi:hypothetical protein